MRKYSIEHDDFVIFRAILTGRSADTMQGINQMHRKRQ